jgi:hypothetical protein
MMKVKRTRKPLFVNIGEYKNVQLIQPGYTGLMYALIDKLTENQIDTLIINNSLNCKMMDELFVYNKMYQNFESDGFLTCACGHAYCKELSEVVNKDDEKIKINLGNKCIERFKWGPQHFENIKMEKKIKRQELKMKLKNEKLALKIKIKTSQSIQILQEKVEKIKISIPQSIQILQEKVEKIKISIPQSIQIINSHEFKCCKCKNIYDKKDYLMLDSGNEYCCSCNGSRSFI